MLHALVEKKLVAFPACSLACGLQSVISQLYTYYWSVNVIDDVENDVTFIDTNGSIRTRGHQLSLLRPSAAVVTSMDNLSSTIRLVHKRVPLIDAHGATAAIGEI